MWRAGAAVILGYLVSQGLNAASVYLWYVAERSAPLVLELAGTGLLFLAVGLATGRLVASVAATRRRGAARVLGGLVVLVTIGNILADVAVEPLSHKLIVLLVMVPAILLGEHHAPGDTAATAENTTPR